MVAMAVALSRESRRPPGADAVDEAAAAEAGVQVGVVAGQGAVSVVPAVI
jgi:hypothetical protein